MSKKMFVQLCKTQKETERNLNTSNKLYDEMNKEEKEKQINEAKEAKRLLKKVQ